MHALYALAIDTGMRQGELFALHRPEVDFGGGSLQVVRSLEELAGQLRLKDVKTAKGRRIDLSPGTMAALNQHRQRMLANGLDVKTGPVFVDAKGGFLRKSNLARGSFARIIDRANLPDTVRFHDLRHTCATMLLLADVNVKVVSERLGHFRIQITLDTYSHVLPTMQKQAAVKMAGIFSQARAAASD